MMLCALCKGSGEVLNTYPDCFIDGMENVIDYPDFIDCPVCKGSGEGAFCPVSDTGCTEKPICPWPCKKLPIPKISAVDPRRANGAADAGTSVSGPPSSWVIREKATAEVICETFNPKLVAALNTEKYEAVPIQKYLASLNEASTRKS